MGRRPVAICHLTTVHTASDQRIFEKECRSLASAGYDVSLVACHPRDECLQGVRILAIPYPASRAERLTRTRQALLSRARSESADIYHLHDPELLLVGVQLALEGRRVIYDAHEDVPRDLRSRHYMPIGVSHVVAALVAGVELAAARSIAGVAAATPFIGDRLRRVARELAVVRNYPVLRAFGPPPDVPWSVRESAVVYAGTIDAGRGIRELVDAMQVVNARVKASLLLAGVVSPPGFRDELARRVGFAHVEEAGILGREAVRVHLARGRVGVVLAEPRPNTINSIPNKMFEYMAAGLPVVSSDFPEWRAVIERERCGIVLGSLDPREVGEAVAMLLTNPDMAETMGRRGRAAVEARYNWETESQALFALYDAVLSAPRGMGWRGAQAPLTDAG